MGVLANTSIASGYAHASGDQNGLHLIIFKGFGCKQHLTPGHKQNSGESWAAQGIDGAENSVWKQDQILGVCTAGPLSPLVQGPSVGGTCSHHLFPSGDDSPQNSSPRESLPG